LVEEGAVEDHKTYDDATGMPLKDAKRLWLYGTDFAAFVFVEL